MYDRCTLYLIGELGLAVIQQRYRPEDKSTYWTEIDGYLVDELYIHERFLEYFKSKAGLKDDKGLYPTVTVRQIMWFLRLKPIQKSSWETVFDKSPI